MYRRIAWILILTLILTLTPLINSGGAGNWVAAADDSSSVEQTLNESITTIQSASTEEDAATDPTDAVPDGVVSSDVNDDADPGADGADPLVDNSDENINGNADDANAQPDDPAAGDIDNEDGDTTVPDTSDENGDVDGGSGDNEEIDNGDTDADASPTLGAADAEASPVPVIPVLTADLDDIQVTLYCTRDPELTRIDNFGTAPITILSIGSTYAAAPEEPYDAHGIVINPGGTRIFRSGTGAVSGTVLTNAFLYTDSAYDQDGAVINTDAGQITKPCDEAPKANLNDIKVTLSCQSNPELTRIDNLGTVPLIINSVGTLYDRTAAEPITVNRTLGAGRTVIYRSGSGATYGTVLSNSFIYTDSAYEKDGVVLDTNAGEITVRCDKQVVVSTELSLSMTCSALPETTTITNIGAGPATLSKLWTTWDQNGNEPYTLNKTLQPGQSITYQSGPGASSNILTSQQIYTENAGTAERLYVQASTGKKFAKSCPPGPKWIEINLSTQYLIAWEGYTRVNETYVSTGRPGFDTPTGTWYINTKLVSQTMAGCIQGECYYVPDVPWVMYFTNWGHALHGAYWHNNFGHVMSHGCVNLPVSFAQWLYYWTPMGTRVVVHY